MRRYIDLHADTVTMLDYPLHDLSKNHLMVDIDSMQRGGTFIQSFSAYVPTGYIPESLRNTLGWSRFKAIADKKDALLEKHSEALLPVLCPEDAESCEKSGKIGLLFTIEDAGVFGDKIERVQIAFNRGVRIASLTRNHENTLAFPNSRDGKIMYSGLKNFGFEVIEEMEQLGIIPDVSHLSDGGFYDLLRVCKKPFIATHSNARALTPHPRNLSDDMIRRLADKGGVMGLNFCPAFLQSVNNDSNIADMVRHVLHIRNVGGSGILALGTDFDGISGELEIGSPAEMPLLFNALSDAGLNDDELDMMCCGNFMRVFRETR